jgi:hypothetical protein
MTTAREFLFFIAIGVSYIVAALTATSNRQEPLAIEIFMLFNVAFFVWILEQEGKDD